MINKYLNNMLVQTSKILGFKVGVIERSGIVVSSSSASVLEEKYEEIFALCLAEKSHIVQHLGYTFYASVTRGKIDYVTFVESVDENAAKYVMMLSSSANGIRLMHNDKFDKSNFIKNILTDSILPGEVFVKSRELRLSYDAVRVAFAILYDENQSVDVYEMVNELFSENNKNFVLDMDNNIVVIVHEFEKELTSQELEKIAHQYADTIMSEAMVNVRVGIGSVADNLKDIAKSYKEARISLEVGKVFDEDKYIISYDNLGIARLIYQLPTTLCELFLSEVFKKGTLDSLDSETLLTIQKFFENNLNVSETSRQLFIHRNTLVYRLDKVRKITELDLRNFEHAIVFKVALMVKKYLVSKPMRI